MYHNWNFNLSHTWYLYLQSSCLNFQIPVFLNKKKRFYLKPFAGSAGNLKKLYPTKDSWQFFFGSLNQVASEKKIGLQTMDDDRHQLIAIAHMTFTVKWHKNDLLLLQKCIKMTDSTNEYTSKLEQEYFNIL